MDADGQQGAESVASPLHHASKRSPEHDDDGAEHKRLHGDDFGSSLPHGDVVPQTPQSEAGQEVLDDTPFERMKSAKHGEDPGSINLLGNLCQTEHLDIEPDIPYEDQDLDTMLQHDLSLKEDPEEPISDISDNLRN